MKEWQDNLYYKGYIAGYQDGVSDAADGRTAKYIEDDLAYLPIQAMEFSVRARNCLLRSGCRCVADVVSLSEETVATMRNMGVKTAAEIAQWLAVHGIHHSVWMKYL